MGTGASRNSDCSHGGREGQLYVALKMENFKVRGDLVPHVYGSIPITGSWDAAKALSMARESASMWELSFVVPPDHETLDFKFLLKPKNNTGTCVVEEGQNRLLTGGALEEGDSRPALFKIGDDEVLEFRVFIKVDILSPFDLAASWRAYQENIEPSRVRGIPDVSINVAVENGSTPTLELDLEHYVVPAPSSIVDDAYAANLTETPRSLSNRNFSVQKTLSPSGMIKEIKIHAAENSFLFVYTFQNTLQKTLSPSVRIRNWINLAAENGPSTMLLCSRIEAAY
ncbi:6-phosphofructo-2-kinase/fructose-2,6-bisphosphatase-like [Zingiber officinale]|uniref:6-phosphofructo-2-kinase/fructose-2, 6-bisphosphatase-like n=1 Tax=Zingiber officinale TaxID=94328 RepID=UPI001C4C7260|nr:6-phosphofructo-2-kinase/fructose-2,6-bisphosphatase-like [Zingiber officinale]